jgi:hypothetical protein
MKLWHGTKPEDVQDVVVGPSRTVSVVVDERRSDYGATLSECLPNAHLHATVELPRQSYTSSTVRLLRLLADGRPLLLRPRSSSSR